MRWDMNNFNMNSNMMFIPDSVQQIEKEKAMLIDSFGKMFLRCLMLMKN